MQADGVIGLICARGGSKGVPKKNLRPLLGKPLIAHTVLCARSCPILDRVMVSTDDDEIASTARSYGAEIPFMRPGALAADDTSKWAVFRHFVREIDNKLGLCPEVIVDLDTGVPLREPSDIEACLRLLVSSEADLAITGYRADRNPYFNMVEVDDAGFAKISKPPPRPFVRRQDAPDVYGLSPAVYAIRTSALWKYDHWSLAKFRLSLMPRERAIDIDTEFDFRLVECLIETRTGTPATQEHS